MKTCSHCGHSQTAHVDGVRCALCGCLPGRQNFVQDRFAFKAAIPTRVTSTSRKR